MSMNPPVEIDLSQYLEEFVFSESINLLSFTEARPSTEIDIKMINNQPINWYINEFWTSKQRKSSSIHEISYRACFKAQLPRFFIKLLSKEGDVIYDPFSGRGTTGIEAGLMGRDVILNDINPLSKILSSPRFNIPTISEINERLDHIPIVEDAKAEIDLSMFYHKKTEAELVSLKNYLSERNQKNEEDHIDKWIRMVATNRLTGHSKGFFSVYTLPPNQAVSPDSQIKINQKRDQIPDYRNIKQLISKKSKTLLNNITEEQKGFLYEVGENARFLCNDARETKTIDDKTVQLTVTSPPFLNIVQYSKDNWLRCWFNSINAEEVEKGITMSRKLEDWTNVMGDVFKELFRITKRKGWVAFEVGEIRKGKIKLEEHVVPLGLDAGFVCKGVLINMQEFTKTSNIWGVNNMKGGTNSNRIVIFHKE